MIKMHHCMEHNASEYISHNSQQTNIYVSLMLSHIVFPTREPKGKNPWKIWRRGKPPAQVQQGSAIKSWNIPKHPTSETILEFDQLWFPFLALVATCSREWILWKQKSFCTTPAVCSSLWCAHCGCPCSTLKLSPQVPVPSWPCTLWWVCGKQCAG